MPIPRAPEQPANPRELLRERVYVQLKDAILTGVLLPGERLDDAELRRWLGVSGTPIRQALHTLSLEGLVETAPQSHSAVIAPRPEDALETLQTIGVLIAGAALLTLRHLTTEDRGSLAALARDVARHHQESDVPSITDAAETYFGAILRACPNPVLLELIAQAGPALGYHVTVTQRALDANLAELAGHYTELAAALLAGDDSQVVDLTKRIFRIGPVPAAG